MKKYTPGKWHDSGSGIVLSDSPVGYGSSTLIANVFPCEHSDDGGVTWAYMGGDKQTREANSALIAAAPDLVEALEDAPILEAYYINGGIESERFMADYIIWWQRRNKALEKAGVVQ